MAYYKPYITGEYNPLYKLNSQGFGHCSTQQKRLRISGSPKIWRLRNPWRLRLMCKEFPDLSVSIRGCSLKNKRNMCSKSKPLLINLLLFVPDHHIWTWFWMSSIPILFIQMLWISVIGRKKTTKSLAEKISSHIFSIELDDPWIWLRYTEFLSYCFFSRKDHVEAGCYSKKGTHSNVACCNCSIARNFIQKYERNCHPYNWFKRLTICTANRDPWSAWRSIVGS